MTSRALQSFNRKKCASLGRGDCLVFSLISSNFCPTALSYKQGWCWHSQTSTNCRIVSSSSSIAVFQTAEDKWWKWILFQAGNQHQQDALLQDVGFYWCILNSRKGNSTYWYNNTFFLIIYVWCYTAGRICRQGGACQTRRVKSGKCTVSCNKKVMSVVVSQTVRSVYVLKVSERKAVQVLVQIFMRGCLGFFDWFGFFFFF